MSNWYGPFPSAPDGEPVTPLEWDIFFPSGLIQIAPRFNAKLRRKGGRVVKLGAGPVTKREALRLAFRRIRRGF